MLLTKQALRDKKSIYLWMLNLCHGQRFKNSLCEILKPCALFDN